MIRQATSSSIQSAIAVIVLVPTFASAEEPTANSTGPSLEQLRERYILARETAARIKRPKRDSPGFRDQLRLWSSAERTKREAAHALVPQLLDAWMDLPDDADELPRIRNEIQAVYNEMATTSLEQPNHDEQSFFADAVWPCLCNEKLTPQRATLLVELTRPDPGIRINDGIAQLGLPTEPFGWNVQDAYSLALLRAGRLNEARRENALLLKKVSLNLDRSRVPNVTVNYRDGKRTNHSLHREYLLHSALIEATDGNIVRAEELLSEARQTEDDDTIIARQERLVDEIESLLSP